ncbi:MAG: pyridoxamine 5'-phosphate oxidase [Steroidobacteraceae bacterium]
MVPDQSLPDPLPAEPLQLAAAWLAEATRRAEQPNPNAMVLATCGLDGRPSARVVLCKEIEPNGGSVRFVSNYDSRKGRELAANPRAALVFHWDHLHRQVRMEGMVEKASVADSDSYFAARARASQLGAHASRQSEPVGSPASLQAQLDATIARFPGVVPRPPHWGGYVFWVESVELWVEASARLHDRARWTRELSVSCSAKPVAGPWSATRLQP